MEECPECFSSDLDALEIDPDCDACDLMECGECGNQFQRIEMLGVEHTDECQA